MLKVWSQPFPKKYFKRPKMLFYESKIFIFMEQLIALTN